MKEIEAISPETLEKLKLTLLEMMRDIDQICKEHKLDYFLIGGTLLGAVRHKGFIPWDDDLDIAMPRKDYEKLIKIFKNNENSKYILQSIETDKNYWLPFAKVRKKNTLFDDLPTRNVKSHRGIFIDIFPLDDAHDEKNRKQNAKVRLAKLLKLIADFKTTASITKEISGTKKYIIKNIVAILFKPISTHRLLILQKKIITNLADDDALYFINVGSQYSFKKQTMPKTMYYPSKELRFEELILKAPSEYIYFLERIYGKSYMELPPKDKRKTHAPSKIIFDTNEEEHLRKLKK